MNGIQEAAGSKPSRPSRKYKASRQREVFLCVSEPPRYAGEFKKGGAVVVVIKKLSFALRLKRYCLQPNSKGERQMDASQEHTRWNCRYHIVWAPKFRRKIIYGKYRKKIGAILRRLCDYKGIEIVDQRMCRPHTHVPKNTA